MKRIACALLLVACGGSTPPANPPASPPAPAPSVALADDAGTDGSTPTPTSTPTSSGTPSGTPTPDDSGGDAAGVAYMESIQLVFKQHKDDLTKACWLRSKSTERAYAGKATLLVGAGGKAASVQTDGTDDAASACIAKQIKKWKLPPPTGTATVTLPIRLHRD